MKKLIFMCWVGIIAGACGDGPEPTEASDLVGIGASASVFGDLIDDAQDSYANNFSGNNTSFNNSNPVTTCFSTGLHRINGEIYIFNGDGNCSSVLIDQDVKLGIGNTHDDSQLEVIFSVNDVDLPSVPARISLRNPASVTFLGNDESCSLSNLYRTSSMFSATITCDAALVAGNGDTLELQDGFSFETSTFPPALLP